VYHEHIGRARDHSDRDETAFEVIADFRVCERGDDVGDDVDEQRVAVWRSGRNSRRSNAAARARPVFHDELLAKRLAE